MTLKDVDDLRKKMMEAKLEADKAKTEMVEQKKEATGGKEKKTTEEGEDEEMGEASKMRECFLPLILPLRRSPKTPKIYISAVCNFPWLIWKLAFMVMVI